MRISLLDSGGTEITDTSYDTAYLNMAANTSFTETKLTGQTHFRSFAYNTTSYSQSLGFKMVVFNPYDSSTYSFITVQSSYYISGSYMNGTKAIGVLKSAETCTGIKVYGNTGNYDDIQLSVYGVK